jgi:hypothetical protein
MTTFAGFYARASVERRCRLPPWLHIVHPSIVVVSATNSAVKVPDSEVASTVLLGYDRQRIFGIPDHSSYAAADESAFSSSHEGYDCSEPSQTVVFHLGAASIKAETSQVARGICFWCAKWIDADVFFVVVMS